MNEMTDNNLDTLIRDTLNRRALLSDLDSLIIADVRRQARRAMIRRWARTVLFSFGLPVVLLLFIAGMFIYVKEHSLTTITLLVIVCPTLALIYSTNRSLEMFSPDDV